MDSLAKRVGKRIKELRERHGLSQRELGKAASTSQVTIYKIETGTVATNLEMLERIASQLGVSPASLLEDARAEPAPAAEPKRVENNHGIQDRLTKTLEEVDRLKSEIERLKKA